MKTRHPLSLSPLVVLVLACAEPAGSVGSADVEAAPAPAGDELCDHGLGCLSLYYALSAEAFGTEGEGASILTFAGYGWSTGLRELYEREDRRTEDFVQRNLERIREGGFIRAHVMGGLTDPTEYVRLKAEYEREGAERRRNALSRRLMTTSYLKLAEEVRQHAESLICYYPNNSFYRGVEAHFKPVVSCDDYTGPRYDWRRDGPISSDAFVAWLVERGLVAM